MTSTSITPEIADNTQSVAGDTLLNASAASASGSVNNNISDSAMAGQRQDTSLDPGYELDEEEGLDETLKAGGDPVWYAANQTAYTAQYAGVSVPVEPLEAGAAASSGGNSTLLMGLGGGAVALGVGAGAGGGGSSSRSAASDEDTQQSETLETVSQDSVSQDSISQDSISQDSISQDSVNEVSTAQNSTDPDSSNQDSTDQDGADQDGTDQDGTDQDGTDPDDDDQDSTDQDGADQDGTDPDDDDQDSTDQGNVATGAETAPQVTVAEQDAAPATQVALAPTTISEPQPAQLVSARLSESFIAKSDVGNLTTATLEFSSAMDTSVAPEIVTNAEKILVTAYRDSLAFTVSSEFSDNTPLDANGGRWINDKTYVIEYNLLDADGVEIDDVTFSVSGAQDANGNTVPADTPVATGTGVDTRAPEAPQDIIQLSDQALPISDSTQTATALSGSAEAGATIEAFDRNGNRVASATTLADEEGQWEIFLDDIDFPDVASFPEASSLYDIAGYVFTATDAAGNQSAGTQIGPQANPSAPVIVSANAEEVVFSIAHIASFDIQLQNTIELIVGVMDENDDFIIGITDDPADIAAGQVTLAPNPAAQEGGVWKASVTAVLETDNGISFIETPDKITVPDFAEPQPIDDALDIKRVDIIEVSLEELDAMAAIDTFSQGAPDTDSTSSTSTATDDTSNLLAEPTYDATTMQNDDQNSLTVI